MTRWLRGAMRSYVDTPINRLLTVACALAWLIVLLSMVSILVVAKDRAFIATIDCPPCAHVQPR